MDLEKLLFNASTRERKTTFGCINERLVIVYGIGEGYFAIKRTLLKPYGIKPAYVMDRSLPSGSEVFQGIPTLTVENLSKLENPGNYVIIVTQGNSEIFQNVKDVLEEVTAIEILWMASFYDYVVHEPEHHSINNPELFFRTFSDEINSTYQLFDDQLSKILFEKIIAAYLGENDDSLPCQESKHQYLDILSPGDSIGLYVGCGGFHGETLLSILESNVDIKTAILFEPDINNFKKMVETINYSSRVKHTNTILVPSGVYSKSGIIKILSGMGLSTRVSDHGEPSQVVSLDDFLCNWKPDYMTIDVEGADLHALKGASNIIRKYNPSLGVSVYHKPEHLWEIPLFLNKICPEYRFSLRNYTGFAYETILYARAR